MQCDIPNHEAQNLLRMFETIQCPYTRDISSTYLADLLLVHSPHRTRILMWLLSSIDPEFEKIIDLHHKNPEISDNFDVDGPIRLLTGLAASLGLCRPGDMELIRGKASARKQIAFWKNVLKAVYEMSEHASDLSSRATEFICSMERMLRTCNLDALFSTASTVLSPVVKKEVQISQKLSLSSKASAPSIDELSQKLSSLHQELSLRKQNLVELERDYPFAKSQPDDESAIHKLVRSLTLMLGDLEQLEITFLQTHDTRFRAHCNRTLPDFGRLGSVLESVDIQMKAYMALFKDLKKIKENHEAISTVSARLVKEDPLCKDEQACLALLTNPR